MLSNRCTFIGRFTADPELRTTKNGVSITRFTLAVPASYSPRGQERGPDFINFCAWRYKAESICRYMKKGDIIAISGSLHAGKYTDKEGVSHPSFEVVVDDFNFVGGKVSARKENISSESSEKGVSSLTESGKSLYSADAQIQEETAADPYVQRTDGFSYPGAAGGDSQTHDEHDGGQGKPERRHIYPRIFKRPSPLLSHPQNDKIGDDDYSDLQKDWEEISSNSEDLPF